MKDCQRIIELIQKGDDASIREGMTLLFEDKGLQKAAYYYYSNYESKIGELLSWEDIFYESILRFVNEVQRGRGPRKNCRAFLRSICRNICEEYVRKHKPIVKLIDKVLSLAEQPVSIVSRKKILEIIGELGGLCEVIFQLRYIKEPPLTDNEILSATLQEQGYNTSAKVIPATIARCKKRFRDLLGNDPSSLFEE